MWELLHYTMNRRLHIERETEITTEIINEYDIVELTEDLNPNLKKGMRGTILLKYDEENFEMEVVDNEGFNIGFEDHFTFTVNKNQIRKIGS